jgi:phosphoglycolate phosphatase-like HAD superfamily hydrolase
VSVYIRRLSEILSADERKAVLPGAEKLLDYVEQREGWFNLLLTSNLYEGAVAKLNSVGLWRYFLEAPVGGFGDAHEEKWEALEYAVGSMERRLGGGLLRREVLLIGDSAYDIRTAKRLGVRHIAVATGFTHRSLLEAEQPEHLVNDLSDFQSIIDIFNLKE